MRDKLPVLVLLFSLIHVTCSFPSANADFRACQKKNGNFPKRGSLCRSYYECKNWIATEEICPKDQHFFPAKGYCVWPEEYPCLEKPKAKECLFPDGKFLKKGTKCKAYYHCRQGVPTVKKCQGELLFDHERGNCDWPELVTCPEEPKSKECPHPNGKFLRPSTGCKIFFDCHNGVATEKRCPEDQLFDPDKQKCEWPEIYTCVEDFNSKLCPNPNGKFLRPATRCKIFYDCRNGIATEKKCPEDQLFDPSKQKCEWPEIYTCIEDLTTIKTTISQSTPVITPSTFQGTSTVISTTVPTISSTEKPTTDYDISEERNSSEEDNNLSTTTEKMLTTPRISTPSKTTSSTESKTKTITVTVPENISSKKGGSTDDVEKFTYSEVKSDKPSPPTVPLDNKDGDSTTITSEITDSVTLHIFCPEPSGHFPHPNNRHKFIACVGGNPTIMDCPANLVYDHKRRSCEYEKRRI